MEQTAQEDSPTKNKLAAGSHHEEGKIENISSADDNSGVSSRISDVLFKWTCIGIGTLLGLLSRAGIIVSSELLKTELSGIVWTNFVACFCMGLFVKAFSILELPKTHNVYLGLTTGYCGTFSSFSSAALELFNVAAGRMQQQPNTTKPSHNITPTIIVTNVSNFAGSTFVHIGVSFIGYHLGETTATLILHGRSNAFLVSCRRRHLSLKIPSISVLTMIIIASLLLTYFYGTSNYFIYVSSALLFALPGTCLRFYLSNTLNFDKRKNQKRLFPVGTFTANALGSLVLAASTLLTLGTKPNNVPDEMIISDQLLCSILSAIGLGFCGALTTMSTFISELTTIENRNYLYLYAISSVFVTVGSFVALWGTYSWSVGHVIESPCLS